MYAHEFSSSQWLRILKLSMDMGVTIEHFVKHYAKPLIEMSGKLSDDTDFNNVIKNYLNESMKKH